VNEGWSADLLLVAFCMGLTSALIASRNLPMAISMALAAVRVGIPLVYFAEYFNPIWTVADDLVYFAHGCQLLDSGWNPLTLVLDPAGWEQLQALSQGRHVLYTWWNLAAMELFGTHYYAPVFCNVAMTFVGASLLGRTLRKLGFASSYCVALEILWLVHWDVIAWSSFLNVKDVLVQTLSIALLASLVSFLVQRHKRDAAAFLALAWLMWWIRFYVPLVMLAATMLWMLTQWNDARKLLLMPLGAIGCYFAIPLVMGVTDYWDFRELGFGTIRFVLTPTPWSVLDVYSYLWIPTLFHWLFFIPAVAGAMYLWRDSRHARLYLIYLGCLISLYSVTQELLGPRQRFQVAFLFAWPTFHFFWTMLPHKVQQAAPSRADWQRAWNSPGRTPSLT